MTDIKVIKDPNGIVQKVVFTKPDAVYEMVIYQYKERGVICFSVQSGCRIGCSFCGTGRKFLRDLTYNEMAEQIEYGIKELGYPENGKETIQIMSMSMGEPLDTNWVDVERIAEKYLDLGYYFFISTVGLDNYKAYSDMLVLSGFYKRFGLQFSLHKTTDEERMKLFHSTSGRRFISIEHMKCIAALFKAFSGGNSVHFNYICTGKEDIDTVDRLANIGYDGVITCSVLCNTKKLKSGKTKSAEWVAGKLAEIGQDVKVFNPAGQDTIGGGCGQLLYVQEYMKKLKRGKEDLCIQDQK